MRRLILLLSFCVVATLHAEDLGVTGAIYSISEPDMLTMLHQKLSALQKSGQLARLEAKAHARVVAHILRPPAVKGIANATVARTFYYTPTLTLHHNITDANGHILFYKGTTINALSPKSVHHINPYAVIPPFTETLLFINSDDKAQVAYAKHLKQTIAELKIILTKGAVNLAAKQLGRVYFDQAGTLAHTFGIHAVPAVVRAKGVRLEIKEIPVTLTGAQGGSHG